MILKENNIIYSVVTSVLTQGEETAIKKLLVSEENYQKFLIKLSNFKFRNIEFNCSEWL